MCYARYLGPERSAAEAAAARAADTARDGVTLTAEAATAHAEAEGLALQDGLCFVRSSNKTGFKSVFKHRNGFKVKVGAQGRQYLGCFPTAEEAALCYTRHIGSERAAAEAKPLTAPEVLPRRLYYRT